MSRIEGLPDQYGAKRMIIVHAHGPFVRIVVEGDDSDNALLLTPAQAHNLAVDINAECERAIVDNSGVAQ